jgi:single-stranded DNA-binding protein
MSIDVACYGIVSPDPEEKTSAADQSYLRLSIRAGSADSVTWLTVKVFADVENLAGRLAKDSRVYIEGSLAADAWIDKEGKARPNLTVMCWRCVETHQIGRAKPPRERESKPKPASQSASPNAILALIEANPAATNSFLATAMGWKLHGGEPNKMKAHRCVGSLKAAKLIKETRADVTSSPRKARKSSQVKKRSNGRSKNQSERTQKSDQKRCYGRHPKNVARVSEIVTVTTTTQFLLR